MVRKRTKGKMERMNKRRTRRGKREGGRAYVGVKRRRHNMKEFVKTVRMTREQGKRGKGRATRRGERRNETGREKECEYIYLYIEK